MGMDDFIDRAKTRGPRASHVYESKLKIAFRDAERRSESGDWSGSKGATLVGLYALCHRLTYRTDPLELEDEMQFSMAARAAATLARDHFDSIDDVVEFVKWVWVREEGRVKWARENRIERKRVSWRLQFSASMLSDYRASLATRKR